MKFLRRSLIMLGLSEESIERSRKELTEDIRYKPVEGRDPVKQEPASTHKVLPLPA